MAHNCDSQYNELFRNPPLVGELLKSLAAEKFAQELDFASLEREPLDFLTGRLRKRETDTIYKINLHSDPICIYIHLESQDFAVIKEHVKTINDLSEVTSMWSTAVKEHDSRVKLSEKQEILADLVKTKFGPSDRANKKIRSTFDAAKLEAALKRILSAHSREDVLRCLE